MSIYGQLLGTDDVRDAVKDHLKLWTPTYIAEIARQRGLAPDGLPTFQTFEIRTDEIHQQAMKLPGLYVRCDGLSPERKSHTTVRAGCEVVISIFAQAAGHEDTTQLVARLGTAVWAAMVKHPDLGGIADKVVWDFERYVPPRTRATVTVGSAALVFTVGIPDFRDLTPGPDLPPADPLADPGDWAAATDLELSVDTQERS